MAKVKVKVAKAAVSARNLKANEYPFDSISSGEWNIPQEDDEPLKMEYLQFNTKSLPIRVSERSIGFIKIGKKFISELLGDKSFIKADDDLSGTLVVKTKDGRNSLSLVGVTALQLIG